MLRLCVLTSHPIQYQAPLYRALAARGDVALKVLFCWDFGVKETRDPLFGKSFRWDVPLLDGYDHEFLPNLARRPGTDHFLGLLNPAAPRRIHDFRADAVVIHGYVHFTSLEVLAAGLVGGPPVLLRGDSTLLPERPLWMRAAKRATLSTLFRALAGALAAGTHNTRYFAHYGVPEDRIFLAPHSVDNPFFRARPDEVRAEALALRAELGIPRDDAVVLFAGKMYPGKACDQLLRAFARKKRKGAHLVMVGDGAQRAELEALAKRCPEASVRFTGFVNQARMPVAYALGDLFVLPSLAETWGLGVNEAMNLGLPIVVSDQVGAAPDLVGPDNGWVFPAGSEDALAQVLDEALADRAALARKGEASLRRIDAWGVPQTADAFVHAARVVSGKLGAELSPGAGGAR